ncbi:hypothetical protein FLX56_08355 [Synechococcus moorigangaii CMS01]|nr:hypothetical protein [Synechococcus moorigangaii CMS01]
MTEKIEFLDARGERARLFPVLAESSKEGRTHSIVLACLAQVPEFGAALLAATGRKVGKRAKIEAFTEVAFSKKVEKGSRPDGLMVVDTGRSKWTAFVEAKVATNQLEKAQVEEYLKLARDVGVDALITFSNQFAPLPEHHPVHVDKRLLKKVELYHFSWYAVLTMANLLRLNKEVEKEEHRYLLRELERFLLHPSAGLRRFDQMCADWTTIVDRQRTGAPISKSSDEVAKVVADWHSELRDLCLFLSRRTGAAVTVKLPPRHRNEPRDRLSDDAEELAKRGLLRATFNVPRLESPIDVEADLTSRTTRISMTFRAPGDKAQQRSRVNWLLRQLKEVDGKSIQIITNWPKRAAPTISTLEEAREDPDIHTHPAKDMLPTSFVVMQLMSDGRKFAGRKTFIESLELLVGDFYTSVAEIVVPWREPAPRMRSAVEEKADPPETDDGFAADSEA